MYSREHAFPARLWARLLYRVLWWGSVGILARQALLLALDPVPGAASLHTGPGHQLESQCERSDSAHGPLAALSNYSDGCSASAHTWHP